jgi:hypothetical protein
MPEKRSHSRKQAPGTTRRWKRTAILALLLLAGGAVVNVAVAWGMYFSNGVGIGRTVTYMDYGKEFVVFARLFHAAGFTEFRYERTPREPDWPERISYIIRYNERYTGDLDETLLAHIDFHDGEPSPKWFVSSGWPIRTFCASENDRYFDLLRIPYVPLATGFTINTLFYALLLWLLFFAPFAARRMLRRRRGLCEQCAYPIGVSPVCTECGAAVRVPQPRGD